MIWVRGQGPGRVLGRCGKNVRVRLLGTGASYYADPMSLSVCSFGVLRAFVRASRSRGLAIYR